jgi:hypothetical protein
MTEPADNVSQQFHNNSGEGVTAELPPQGRGLNWGAFFLTWIWGIGNNTPIALISVIPFVGLVMAFVLLFNGNKWAWQNKKWPSVAQFHRTQKMWGGVGFLCMVLPVAAIVCFAGVAAIMAFSMLADSPPAQAAIKSVQRDSLAVAALGAPVNGAGWVSGTINDENGSMRFDLDVPVVGSKTRGTVDIAGAVTAGNWDLKTFELVVDGTNRHIPLKLVK